MAHRSTGQERFGFAGRARSASSLDDRASFRRFCGFSGTEATPERTAFVRFRKELVAHRLDRLLFTTVTAQLTSRAVTLKTGTLVDATIITSASEVHLTAIACNLNKRQPSPALWCCG